MASNENPRPLKAIVKDLRATAQAIRQTQQDGQIPQDLTTKFTLLKDELFGRRRELVTIAQAADILDAPLESGQYTQKEREAAEQKLQRLGIDSLQDSVVTVARKIAVEDQNRSGAINGKKEDPAYIFGSFPENLVALQTIAHAITTPSQTTPHDVAVALSRLMTKDEKTPGGKRPIRNANAAFFAVIRALDVTATRTSQWPLPRGYKAATPIEQDAYDAVRHAVVAHLARVWKGKDPLNQDHVFNAITKDNAVSLFRTLMWEYYRAHQAEITQVWKTETTTMKEAVVAQEKQKAKEPYLFSPEEAHFLVSLLQNHYGVHIIFKDHDLDHDFRIADQTQEEELLKAMETIRRAHLFSGTDIERADLDRRILNGRNVAIDKLQALFGTDSSLIVEQNIDGPDGEATRALQTILTNLFSLIGNEALLPHFLTFLRADTLQQTHTTDKGIVDSIAITRSYQAPPEFENAQKEAITSQQEMVQPPVAEVVIKPVFPEDELDRRDLLNGLISDVLAKVGNKRTFTFEEFSALFGETISSEVINRAIAEGYVVPRGNQANIIHLNDLVILSMMESYSFPSSGRRGGKRQEGVTITQLRTTIDTLLKDRGITIFTPAAEGTTPIQLLAQFAEAAAVLSPADKREIETFLSSRLIHLDHQLTQAFLYIQQTAVQEGVNIQHAVNYSEARLVDTQMIRQLKQLQLGEMQAFEKGLSGISLRDINNVSYSLIDYLIMIALQQYNTVQVANSMPSIQEEIRNSRITFTKFWLFARDIAKIIILKQNFQ